MPAGINQVGALQIDEAADSERRGLRVHLGWALIGLLLLFAAAGLFGAGGPIASRTIATDDGELILEYQRIVRRGAETELLLRTSNRSTITIPSEYFDYAHVQSIVPQPQSARSMGDVVEFQFADCGPCQVRFHLGVRDMAGTFRGNVTAGERFLELRQIILP